MDAESELPNPVAGVNPQSERVEQEAAPEDPAKGDTYVLSGDFRNATVNIKSILQADAHWAINREYMLKRIRKDWLEGVLEPARSSHALVALNLKHNAGLVENPWSRLVQRERNTSPIASTSDHIFHVFNACNGNLLILGEPGAGKTITLLQLAQELVNQAENDPQRPIPIVLNLASWKDDHVALETWLIKELRGKYFVPQIVAEAWIAKDSLALLLDGLDEIPEDKRPACVEAINAYRQGHGPAHIVVCSRRADYVNQPRRLQLDEAILLQSLDKDQIDQILSRHHNGQDVAATLEQDTTMRQLAQSPLMLNIMLMASQEVSSHDWSRIGTISAHRERLFDVYLSSVFKRRGRPGAELEHSTLQVLPWLAHHLSTQGQTVFLIEGLTPDLLKTKWQRWLCTLGMSLLIAGLLALSTMLFYLGANSPLQIVGRMTLAIGLAGLLTAIASTRLNNASTLILHLALTWLTCSWALKAPIAGVVAAVIFGIPTGAGVVAAKAPRITEKLHWSWRRISLSVWMVVLIELATGLFIYLTAGSEALTAIANSFQLLQFAALLIGPGILLAFGWRPSLRVASTVKPNQGFWQSLRNAAGVLVFVLIILTPISITTGLGDNILHEQKLWDSSGLLSSILFVFSTIGLVSVPFALRVGGAACLQQLTVRSILAYVEKLPWNLIQILDHATDRILLQRVGGGYIFQHRLLQDYFAHLQSQPTESEEAWNP